METMEPKIQPEEALKRARLLFGCYRKSDAADPETYVMAVSAMLAQFDRETVFSVTDPIHGLPSKTDFVPTIREIKVECERVRGGREARARLIEIERKYIEEWNAHGIPPQRHSWGAVRPMTDSERKNGLRIEHKPNPEMAARIAGVLPKPNNSRAEIGDKVDG